jgi:hypothetical protein
MMDYDQVLRQVFVGSCPEDPADADRLKDEAGVSAVLNLQTDGDMEYRAVDREGLAGRYRELGVELVRVPTRDFDTEDLARNLPSAAAELDRLVAAGHTVYVHCTSGIGRSPSTVIAYLAWYDGRDLDAAVAHVQRCRACSPDLEAIRAAVDRRRPPPSGPSSGNDQS